MDFLELTTQKTIAEIEALYPVTGDFFANYNMEDIERALPLSAALEAIDESRLSEFGYSRFDIFQQFSVFLSAMTHPDGALEEVRSITVLGGRNKFGQSEKTELTIFAGEVVSIVGPTGSGKSRLLGDIECLAQRDTPTRRQILINGRAPDDEARCALEGRLVAQLSQNMNFVMDLSVREFLEMHAQSRMIEQPEAVIENCFACANTLAGEKFAPDTKVTQLSGGQSRALMIADAAYISSSPVVLIDEIENAGIDRRQAAALLSKKEKIVLISTHDPLLAISADRRIVIKNGAIHTIIDTSPEERESLAVIQELDDRLLSIRHSLRMGERILMGEGALQEVPSYVGVI